MLCISCKQRYVPIISIGLVSAISALKVSASDWLVKTGIIASLVNGENLE